MKSWQLVHHELAHAREACGDHRQTAAITLPDESLALTCAVQKNSTTSLTRSDEPEHAPDCSALVNATANFACARVTQFGSTGRLRVADRMEQASSAAASLPAALSFAASHALGTSGSCAATFATHVSTRLPQAAWGLPHSPPFANPVSNFAWALATQSLRPSASPVLATFDRQSNRAFCCFAIAFSLAATGSGPLPRVAADHLAARGETQTGRAAQGACAWRRPPFGATVSTCSDSPSFRALATRVSDAARAPEITTTPCLCLLTSTDGRPSPARRRDARRSPGCR